MKKTILIIGTAFLSTVSLAFDVDIHNYKGRTYEVGKVYSFSGERATYLGKDENGWDLFQGYVREVKVHTVKKAPRFNSKTRKVSKRRFHIFSK